MYWKSQSSVSQRNKTPAITSWAAFLASASPVPMGVKKQVHRTPKTSTFFFLVASPSSCDSPRLPHTAVSAPIHTTGFLLCHGGLWPDVPTSSHCRTLSPFYLKGLQLSLRFTMNASLSLQGSLVCLPCPTITPITLSPLQMHPVLCRMWAHVHCLTTSCLCVHLCTMRSKRARTKSHLSLEPCCLTQNLISQSCSV